MSSPEQNQQSSPGGGNEPEFVVVRNDEGQYSIWPAGRSIPAGWQTAGPRAGKAECLAYIEEHWQDIRPLSVQRRLSEQGLVEEPGGV